MQASRDEHADPDLATPGEQTTRSGEITRHRPEYERDAQKHHRSVCHGPIPAVGRVHLPVVDPPEEPRKKNNQRDRRHMTTERGATSGDGLDRHHQTVTAGRDVTRNPHLSNDVVEEQPDTEGEGGCVGRGDRTRNLKPLDIGTSTGDHPSDISWQ